MLSSPFRPIPRRLVPKCRQSGRYLTTSHSISSTDTPLPPPLRRAQPWKTQPNTDFQKTQNGTALSRYNLRLSIAASNSYIAGCFHILSEMKEKKVAPDLTTYHYVLSALASIHAERETWAVYEDMLAVGIKPDVHVYNLLLEALKYRRSTDMWSILREMSERSIEPNSITYSKIVRTFTTVGNLATSLRYLHEIRNKGLKPDLETLLSVVDLAAQKSYPRLALDLIERYQDDVARSIPFNTWMNCLRSSVKALWKDGTLKSWEAVVNDQKFDPNASLCISVLNVAGRHGLPDLATSVLAALKKAEIPWKEIHFAPLIQAFVNNGQISEAFSTFHVLQANNIPISPRSLSPIVDVIKEDEHSLDAAWSIVESLPNPHISALNTLIKAAGAVGDLQRAVGAYKSLGDMKLQPNLDTFNSLLKAAVTARHPLGSVIMEDMKAASVAPDQTTHELLINLSLAQETYEDAFYHLEEMKAAGFTPSQSVYEAIVWRCATNGDERYTIALDEMKEMGYEDVASKSFRIKALSAFNVALRGASKRGSNASPTLDKSAQRYIETGGAHI
ncbi:hypothetical protein L218DRAFT_1077388 [Marasmius fiardii PR-910]|nr:hypothetical protein L218DRAFT_1077388 [Marasmius fiardii PR-910]